MTDDPPPGAGRAVPPTRQSTDPVGRVPGGLVENMMLSAARVDAHTRQNVARPRLVSRLSKKARNWQKTRRMNKIRREVSHFEHC